MVFLFFRRHIIKREDSIVHTNNKFKKGQVDPFYGFALIMKPTGFPRGNESCQHLPLMYSDKLMSPHVRKTKRVLDSGFHSLDSGFFASGTWIQDSNRSRDSGFLELNSIFQSREFRITLQRDWYLTQIIITSFYFIDSSLTSWIEGKKPWNLSLGPDMSPSHFCAWRISLLTGKSLKQYIHLSSNSVLDDWLPDETPSRESSCKRQYGIEIQ